MAFPGYQGSALRLARLLLADPLTNAAKWEEELADPKAVELAGGKSLLVKYVWFFFFLGLRWIGTLYTRWLLI